MFSFFPGPGAILLIFALVFALVGTLLGIALKLLGVLLLAWTWVLAPVPFVILLAVLVAGILALVDEF